MPSIKEVARLAGVSIATVSNVLNQTRPVSAELKERVLEAVSQLGYVADPLASNLKKRHARTIGLVTTRIASVFYPYVIDGIHRVVQEAGYDLILHDSNDDPAIEEQSIRRLTQSRVSGIILDTSHDKLDEKYFLNLAGLSQRGYQMPIVSIELDLARYGLDSVYVDGVDGGCQATRHLIDCGCRQIAHITGPGLSSLAQDRLLGYKRALITAGCPVDDRLIRAGNFSQYSGYQAACGLLDSGLPVDGIFAANDQMAAGACHAVLERGLRIPEDIRLVGYDNTFIASIVQPSITTIDVPKTEIGRQAALYLLDRIEGRTPAGPPRSLRLAASLVVRTTTDREARSDWELFDW